MAQRQRPHVRLSIMRARTDAESSIFPSDTSIGKYVPSYLNEKFKHTFQWQFTVGKLDVRKSWIKIVSKKTNIAGNDFESISEQGYKYI